MRPLRTGAAALAVAACLAAASPALACGYAATSPETQQQATPAPTAAVTVAAATDTGIWAADTPAAAPAPRAAAVRPSAPVRTTALAAAARWLQQALLGALRTAAAVLDRSLHAVVVLRAL
jgi:hypothetical protein